MDQDKKEITLRTRLGTIIGFTDFRNARIFYNIPYGKAPIGTRKFAKPEPFGAGMKPGMDMTFLHCVHKFIPDSWVCSEWTWTV